MKIFDISMSIHPGMTVYKNKEAKRPILTITRDFVQGAGARETRITMDLHTGTHMDAPLHMIAGGRDSEIFTPDNTVARARVLDFTGVKDSIGPEDLKEKDICRGYFVLLKTQNSYEDFFNPDFVYLSQGGAEYLADRGVKGVGIDALGIERNQPGHETHKILLKKGILILEGLRLKDIPEGDYLLFAAPLKIAGVEAAPIRALLVQTEE